MPQADLTYSADLNLDAGAALAAIEAVIHARDDSAGACKGRGMEVREFHHSHVLLVVRMIPKSHRTPEWKREIAELLRAELGRHIHQPCALAVLIEDDLVAYAAGPHGGQDD